MLEIELSLELINLILGVGFIVLVVWLTKFFSKGASEKFWKMLTLAGAIFFLHEIFWFVKNFLITPPYEYMGELLYRGTATLWIAVFTYAFYLTHRFWSDMWKTAKGRVSRI